MNEIIMLLEKLSGIEERYQEINQQLLQVGDDYQRAAELGKEKSDLEPLIEAINEYKDSLAQLKDARTLLDVEDDEMKELAEMEVQDLEAKIQGLESRIKKLLLPKDPRDKRNVILEIRAGAGGDEAGLFAGDLFRMYSRYAERQGWKVEILSLHETGVGGIKEISAIIKGKGAFSKLKYESGVHRVQRVPETESQGRIHTSTATVAVLAEVDDVEIDISPNDIQMDVFIAGGPGGQSVQKNATAIRLTHEPTGIVVQCQDERSQSQNRARAMSILKARLYELEEQKRREKQEQARRSQVGTGGRSEKIRTYNFPQNRVTDHRINYSSHQLDAVLDGEINEFIEELSTEDEAKRLAEAGLE
ncbi:MAG: peptide chain release factor 1 [Anaerolineales bacterium]|nr:peptide chain release factor 1 [Anaerolineales bacterium]MBS3752081.1 peptide chain release factor 1 [Anaerolineales bacterium]